jgi:hypothetical protein|tara:strand:+ start:1244 stop:1429 length:186 start_codon:yes stop_codon:yes gene_type:complete
MKKGVKVAWQYMLKGELVTGSMQVSEGADGVGHVVVRDCEGDPINGSCEYSALDEGILGEL